MNTGMRKLLYSTGLITLLAMATAFAENRSGYDYIKAETQAIQDDDFANPGLLTVDAGEDLFNMQHGNSGRSCASCHGQDDNKLDPGKLAQYPVYDNERKEIITLQSRIKNCRLTMTENQLPTNHPQLVALETFVRNQAYGEKVNVQTDDSSVTELLNKGKKLYKTRYGLIDMSCYHCHELYPGQMIRGQKISQGQANGFPAYRLDTGEMANLGLRIQQCMKLMRAEPFASDSEEIKLLQLYIMARSNGLTIETPAVRY